VTCIFQSDSRDHVDPPNASCLLNGWIPGIAAITMKESFSDPDHTHLVPAARNLWLKGTCIIQVLRRAALLSKTLNSLHFSSLYLALSSANMQHVKFRVPAQLFKRAWKRQAERQEVQDAKLIWSKIFPMKIKHVCRTFHKKIMLSIESL